MLAADEGKEQRAKLQLDPAMYRLRARIVEGSPPDWSSLEVYYAVMNILNPWLEGGVPGELSDALAAGEGDAAAEAFEEAEQRNVLAILRLLVASAARFRAHVAEAPVDAMVV